MTKGTIFKHFVFGKFRALNTSLDFGWISPGEKGPHKQTFWSLILVVDRGISVNYMYCNEPLPVAVQSSVCTAALHLCCEANINIADTISVIIASILPLIWHPQFLFCRGGPQTPLETCCPDSSMCCQKKTTPHPINALWSLLGPPPPVSGSSA